jgi:heat shock protein HtpX
MAAGAGTFYEYAARARSRSRWLLIVGVTLTAIAGALIGAAATAVLIAQGNPISNSAEFSLIGGGIGLALGLLSALFASSGAVGSFILSSLRARELPKHPRTAPQRQLRNIVRELSIAASLPEPKVYLIDDQAINAMATGVSPEQAAIAVTTGALEALDREELSGVIAHELAHVRNYDIRFGLYLAGIAALFALVADLALNILRIVGRGNRSSRSSSGGGGGAVLMLVVLLVAVVCGVIGGVGLLFIRAASSRSRELLADASAIEITRNPEGLARALTKIAGASDRTVDTASSGSAHLFFAEPKEERNELLATHPLLLDRINALRRLAGQRPLKQLIESNS